MPDGQSMVGRNATCISAVIGTLAENWTRDRISVGDLLAVLGGRGHGLLLLILALPNLIPVPLPGLSAVLGIPMMAISLQMMLGRAQPWIPPVVRRRAFARSQFAAMLDRSLPHLRRIERVLLARFPNLTKPPMMRVIGLACLVLAALISLPIPLTGIPLALPIILLALGLIESDGACIIIGLAASTVAAVYSFVLAEATILAGILLLRASFGF